jgi:peptidoglycan DL-endopeptidase LytE
MKSIFKIITLSTAILGAGLLINDQAEASTITKSDIKTQVNDTLLPPNEVRTVWVDKEHLFVPIRPLAEEAGYGLDWYNEGEQSVVTFTYENNKVVVKTGDSTAMVNGTPVQMENAPFKVNGTTYVPLRFIGESLGHLIQWDKENGIAILATDGKFHSPAWYRPPTSSELASQIIGTAKQYLGVPYVYGGSTPSGFDCSGFLMYVFAQYGIDLPRSAAGMYTVGTPVKGELLPGDLVFFKDGPKVSHVGMYIGNNQYIDAASGSRMRVTYTDMNSSWSKKHYVGAKRVL